MYDNSYNLRIVQVIIRIVMNKARKWCQESFKIWSKLGVWWFLLKLLTLFWPAFFVFVLVKMTKKSVFVKRKKILTKISEIDCFSMVFFAHSSAGNTSKWGRFQIPIFGMSVFEHFYEMRLKIWEVEKWGSKGYPLLIFWTNSFLTILGS